MSGYLKRLTASVTRPQPRVHPFVEPLFSAGRHEEPSPGTIFPAETRGVAARAVELSAPESRSAQVFLPARQEPASNAVSEAPAVAHATQNLRTRAQNAGSELLAGSAAEGGAHTPLLPRINTHQINAHAEERATDFPVAEERPAGKAATRIAALPLVLNGATNVAGQEWRFEPIVAAGVAAQTGSGEGMRAASSRESRPDSRPDSKPDSRQHSILEQHRDSREQLRAARQDRITPARRSSAGNAFAGRAAPVKVDEIQIHIGRIEVMAVAAPTPRPAAAPARRSQTLDEYLSRTNGRQQ